MVVLLTATKIENLRPPETGQHELADKIVPGLRLRIGASGAKTYILRKRLAGRSRNIALGRHTLSFGLADARKKARHFLSLIEDGKDPAEIERAEKARRGHPQEATDTVAALVARYMRIHGATRRTAKEMQRLFDVHVLPKWGDRPADSITKRDVVALVDGIHHRPGKRPTPVQARTVLVTVHAMFNWAEKRDEVDRYPARGVPKPKGGGARDRVLSDEELAAFMAACEAEVSPFGVAFMILALTGQRLSEVVAARRSEVDIDRSLWTIPGARAKNGEPHEVPLAPQVIDLINGLERRADSPFLFPAEGNPTCPASGDSKVKKRIEKRVVESLKALCEDRNVAFEEPTRWTLHDLRRTCATGLQRLWIRFEVIEAVLNHRSGSRSSLAAVYQRHAWGEEKREALSLCRPRLFARQDARLRSDR